MKNREQVNGNVSNKNILRFIFFMAILFFIYILRLAYLQVFDVNMYRIKGDKKIITKEPVYQDRGSIFDRNMRPLAANLQFNTAYISQAITKNEKKKLLEEQNSIDKSDRSKIALIEKYEERTSLPEYSLDEIEKISSILEIDPKSVLKKLENGIAGPIAFKVDDQKKNKIEELNLGYISFYNQSERYYPGKEISASTIGFVENGSGLYGLEKQYDKLLAGKKGYIEFYKAIGGTILPFEATKTIEGEKSKSIVTSLDEEVQKLVHDSLVEEFKINKPLYATAIVSNPNTGEIIAMESLPSFDANNPRALNSDIDKLFLDELEEDKVDQYIVDRWNNYNVSSIYEPGSTFKSVTTSIALDSTREIEDKHYFCKGSIEIAPGVTINCWRYDDPHGDQTLMEAFSNSCNPAYVGIIDDIGREKFVSYGNSFKFGQKTGIDLPNEIAGSFPTDTNINDVDFRPMSYGHSISATPIQELMALNATVNGGIYYRPHILKAILDSNNKVIKEIGPEAVSRVISEKTSSIMRTFYENNSKNVYGFKDDKLRIGHKSGTTVVKKSENIFDKDKTDNIGMNIISNYALYPSNAPKYSLLVLIANPLEYEYGSSLSEFINKVFIGMEELDSKKGSLDITDKELVKIPDIKGLPIVEAREKLRAMNLRLDYDKKIMGEYNLVESQSPIADGFIEDGSTILITAASKEEVMLPDLIGKDVNEAKEILKSNNIKLELIGNGDKIIEQAPKASSIMKLKDKLKLKTQAK